jgi:2-polyprenyl-3-methyl-5-hydroxy-6-metoxy-1,4-benzoquinol methylase
VRTGQAQMNLMHPDAEPLWVSYVAPTRLQWPNLTALATQGWTRAGILPLAKQGMRILDVGCGSGFKSFTLLQHDPTAHVTAVDSPRVLEIAADIAGQMQVTSQVSFQVGNIADTLAPESFDLILYGSLMHYYPVDECIGILSKAWKALKKDGRVIVNSMIMDEERTESAGLLSMIDISNCAPFAQNYTFSEYKSMLQAAGFANVVQASPAMVIGYKGE